VAFSWGCGDEGEQLLVPENAQDSTYEIICPNTDCSQSLYLTVVNLKNCSFPKLIRNLWSYIPYILLPHYQKGVYAYESLDF